MKRQDDNSRLVEVFTGLRWEAELVKGMLITSHIEATLKEEMDTTGIYLSPVVTVLVNEKDYDVAMDIVRNREKDESKADS